MHPVLLLTWILAATDWTSFRGPNAAGVNDEKPLPSQWSAAAKENVAWRTPVPGLGYSSPVVAGDRIFVTTAINLRNPERLKDWKREGSEVAEAKDQHSFRLLCLDRKSGKMLWERTAIESVPKIRRHWKGSHANSTPAVSGNVVVAWFGSEGLYAYRTDGGFLWKQDPGVLNVGWKGRPEVQWSFASSPVIHDGKVIAQAFLQQGSFVAAFDLNNGAPVWRKTLDEVPAWTTPVIAGDTLILAGGHHIYGLNPRTGEERWRTADETEVRTPTPVVYGDRVLIAGGYPLGRPFFALDGKTGREVWRVAKGGPYTPTPVIYRDIVYIAADNGILSAYRASNGNRLYQQRLEGGFSASGVAGDGKLYFPSEDGIMWVVQAGESYQLVNKIDMGEALMATPALALGEIFVRSRDAVYCVRSGS